MQYLIMYVSVLYFMKFDMLTCHEYLCTRAVSCYVFLGACSIMFCMCCTFFFLSLTYQHVCVVVIQNI